MALKPEPLSFQQLSHMDTTGQASMNYFIGDAIMCTDECSGQFSEKFLRLAPDVSCMMGGGIRALNPHFRPADPYDDAQAAMRAVRRDYILPETGLLIGNFCAYDRFDPDYLARICDILLAVDDRLVLIARSIDADRRIREFARKPKCADRIIFTHFIDADPRRLLTPMGAIDNFLDCWKFNAHTLFLQYLYAVLTLSGQTVASRVGASLLTAHGFPRCIKTTRDEWKNYAIRNKGVIQTRADHVCHGVHTCCIASRSSARSVIDQLPWRIRPQTS